VEKTQKKLEKNKDKYLKKKKVGEGIKETKKEVEKTKIKHSKKSRKVGLKNTTWRARRK